LADCCGQRDYAGFGVGYFGDEVGVWAGASMKSFALTAIAFYQRYLSPLKGFSCAYRVHTGCASCSVLGSRVIARYGLRHGLGVLMLRLNRCGVAHRRFTTGPRLARRQAGFCDLSCDLPCDFSAPDLSSSLCNSVSYCPCDCGDWNSRKSKTDEKYVYIPPHSGRRVG
jgi:uncharacterized protein